MKTKNKLFERLSPWENNEKYGEKTPFFDENGKQILIGDIVIIGDNPVTHLVAKILFDKNSEKIYACYQMSNGFYISYLLEDFLKKGKAYKAK